MAQPRRMDTVGMAMDMLAGSTASGGRALFGSMNMVRTHGLVYLPFFLCL